MLICHEISLEMVILFLYYSTQQNRE